MARTPKFIPGPGPLLYRFPPTPQHQQSASREQSQRRGFGDDGIARLESHGIPVGVALARRASGAESNPLEVCGRGAGDGASFWQTTAARAEFAAVSCGHFMSHDKLMRWPIIGTSQRHEFYESVTLPRAKNFAFHHRRRLA